MNISIQITLMFGHNSRNAPVCAPHNMINKIGVTHSAKLNESSEKYKLRRNWGRRRRRVGGRALPPQCRYLRSLSLTMIAVLWVTQMAPSRVLAATAGFLWLFDLFERIYILAQRKHSVVYSLCDYYSICISPALSLPQTTLFDIVFLLALSHESTQNGIECSTIISVAMYGRYQSCEPNAESNLFELC